MIESREWIAYNFVCDRDVVKWLKTPDFDSGIRRFESCRPCHIVTLRNVPDGTF